MNWMLIVNPLAGRGAAGKMWPEVKEALSRASVDFSHELTSSPLETISIASRAIAEGRRGIAVYGGDGTVSDAASAIVGSHCDIVLAVIPAGSGNDWCRSAGIPTSPAAAVQVMAGNSYRRLDTGICRWRGGSRFFVNSAGMGLDGLVLQRALKLRRFVPFPKTAYMVSLAFCVLRPPSWKGVFRADGSVFHSGRYMTLTVGIGRYSGGGMLLSPSAIPDDGQLDALALEPMNPFRIVFNARRIWKGTLDELPQASHGRGGTISVETPAGSSVILEADGEPVELPGDAGVISFTCRPCSLLAAVPSFRA